MRFCGTPVLLGSLILAITSPVFAKDLTVRHLASYETGLFNKSAAEIVSYQASTGLIYVVNGAAPSIDVLRFTGKDITLITKLDLDVHESPTSVAAHGDYVAVAVHDADRDDRQGKIVIFGKDQTRLTEIKAGFLPDMVTFSPDGAYIIAANEGERNFHKSDAGAVDPVGSITLITVGGNFSTRQITFDQVSADIMRGKGVRLSPGKTPSQDFEPEYITVSKDSRTAWISLQENNAIAVLDIPSATITNILPLGLKDHSVPGQGLDPDDKDGVHIGLHPVMGMYMPDTITTMVRGGKTYLLTANEGDSRDEEVKAKKAKFDNKALSKAQIKALGKLRLSATDGDTDGDGDIDVPHSYGARSFSIFDDTGRLVFDSGDDFERITAAELGVYFNSDNDEEDSGDGRSDNKGPEPEVIITAEIDGHTYAFIGLERVGGIMIYDVTTPAKARFDQYVITRNFGHNRGIAKNNGDKTSDFLGPEGFALIPADQSPTGKTLLLVAYEVSGNVEVLEISK